MAGLLLSGGVRAGGNYTPLLPASATAPTASAVPIAEKAYGITADTANGGSNIAGYGAVGVGIFAIAAMVYLWWSLPR